MRIGFSYPRLSQPVPLAKAKDCQLNPPYPALSILRLPQDVVAFMTLFFLSYVLRLHHLQLTEPEGAQTLERFQALIFIKSQLAGEPHGCRITSRRRRQ